MTTLSAQTLAAGDPGLPLHRRLAEALASAIRSGEIDPSAPLPSEKDIARDCDVALGTVRQAMSLLREAGLIERRQGRGTFVKRADFSRSLLRFFRFGGDDSAIPEGAILASVSTTADAATAEALDLTPGDPVLRLERVRSLGGRPVVHEVLWLALPTFTALTETATGDYPDLLYPFYEEQCGVLITRAHEELSFDEATDRDSELLGSADGAPIIAIERVAHDLSGRPVERRISRGDARTFRYRVEIS